MASEREVWLVRHGETEWSRDRRHTSRTDVALTKAGAHAAGQLAARLLRTPFELVLTSPRQRARRTANLCGFGDAEVDEDLVEWDYGEYEGITTAEIRTTVPGWTVWTHESPGGETAEQVAERLDRVVARVRAVGGRSLVFGHGHALRALGARWIGQPASAGRYLVFDTAQISVLGYDHDTPAILRWNC
ncbi:MAG: histidine phosphatase family protein [Actinomycetota bacterium]|nr:histidine phosphatase family protein [Actinomycetota bacterium]